VYVQVMAIAPDLRGAALDGRYELEELIGEGTFGRVYRGRDRRLQRAVAIKVVKPWWAEDPEWVAVFEREARLLARVNHPGIVQIHDVGHCADGLYYVSELVAGEDLAARLRRADRAGLDPAEARSLALGLCGALAGAHAAGIVHRDVKPANVLIAPGPLRGPDTPPLVKVADFGVARLAESTEDGASLIVGTPRYMAPEQADGGRITPATDVYAIGAILYEMLTGRPPFDGRTAVELAVRHRDAAVPPLPADVDPDLARVVLTALAKRPADRYPDAGVMARALERSGADRTSSPYRRGQAGEEVVGNRGPAGEDKPSPHHRDGAAQGVAGNLSGAGSQEPSPHGRDGAAQGGAGNLSGAGSQEPSPHGRDGAPEATAGPPASQPHPTRLAPRRAPRTNVNPSARRRSVALLALAGAVLGGLIAAALLTGGLHGSASRDGGKAGAGAAAPVEVPLLVGESSSAGQARLRSLHLRVRTRTVPAPGIRPGTVTQQIPAGGHTLPAHGTVHLSVAEVPRWRSLTTFTGRSSVAFRIRGERWRLLVSASASRHCTLLFFCHSSQLQVLRGASGSSAMRTLSMQDGIDEPTVVQSGPGVYRVTIDPASSSTRWSIRVEDDY
jgi:serine/threonine protein kinase